MHQSGASKSCSSDRLLTSAESAPGELQILDGASLAAQADLAPYAGPAFDFVPDRPVLITGLTSTSNLHSIAGLLLRIYPSDHVVEITGDVPGNKLTMQLRDLTGYVARDSMEISISPLSPDAIWRGPVMLHRLIPHLRSPDGCPWDREQTYSSLAEKVVEEAYEVVDAIRNRNPAELAGELGDLLLLVGMLSQIAEEQGDFTIEDVYEHVNQKLVRRHPHVFGDATASTPEEVVTTWQRVKSAEAGQTVREPEAISEYQRLPASMPALEKAKRLIDPRDPDSAMARQDFDGRQLLEIVTGLCELGLDPETELNRALIERFGREID